MLISNEAETPLSIVVLWMFLSSFKMIREELMTCESANCDRCQKTCCFDKSQNLHSLSCEALHLYQNLVNLTWEMRPRMLKLISSLHRPLCPYTRQNAHNWNLTKFLNDPRKIMDVRVLMVILNVRIGQTRKSPLPQYIYIFADMIKPGTYVKPYICTKFGDY